MQPVPFPEPAPWREGGVVAIGNFDGVHAGHRMLLAKARQQADKVGKPLVVLTFEPHPRQVLFPQQGLKRLMFLEEKTLVLAGVGVAGVAVLPFDRAVAGWTAMEFVQTVLVEWLNAVDIFVGEGFRFGAGAQGDAALLTQIFGEKHVFSIPLLRDAGGVVSSTRLRALRDADVPDGL